MFTCATNIRQVLNILRAEIAALEAGGPAEPGFFELRRGAGAYICGEESAMLESIEGKRGLPRHRPPYIAEVGLFGRPTLNNNVETLYWVPAILAQRRAMVCRQGKPGHPGPRSWSVSGRVANPGVVVAPAGVTVARADRTMRRHGGTGTRSRPTCPAARRAAFCPPRKAMCRSISAASWRRSAPSWARTPSWSSARPIR